MNRRDVLKLGVGGLAGAWCATGTGGQAASGTSSTRGQAASGTIGIRDQAASGTGKTDEQNADDRGMKVILWCWDSRMMWDDQPEAISTRMAAPTAQFPYHKRPESYLQGFKRLVDYCAEIGVHSVLIWGFLRDSHGGVRSARELCSYAADRGVGIIPGVGLCSYGGYFLEGDHPFNLTTYLRKHPDRAVLVPRPEHKDQLSPVLDPSLAANQQWWREGLEWMLETFSIAGVNFEMGDFLVNPSASARQARAELGFDTDENLQDIVVATGDLTRQALQAKPDGLFINSTYRGYHQIKDFPRMAHAGALDPRVVWQYTLTHMVRRPEFPHGFAGAPPHRRYGYLHWFNSSTRSTDKDYVADVERVFPAAQRLGFEFIGTYGEVSARSNQLADRNYRSMVAAAGQTTRPG